MSPDPTTSQQTRNPYPENLERRVSSMEGWRGSVDEWRKGMDTWRTTIERDGLVTAVAVMGTKLEQVNREVSRANAKLDSLDKKVEHLEDDRNVRRGVTLTGKTAAMFISSAVGILTIIGLLIALLSGGGPS